MKIVVFSDVHGQKMIVDKILDFNPDSDYVISLGDTELQSEYLRRKDIIHVKGNYPRDPGFLYDSNIVLEGKNIFFTHGHKHKVSRGITKLVKLAIDKDYDIVLYGHTHIAAFEMNDGIAFINPGSCSKPRNSLPPSYLIIELDGEDVSYTFKESLSNQTIEIS